MLDKFIHSLKINDEEEEDENVGYMDSESENVTSLNDTKRRGSDVKRVTRSVSDISNPNIIIMKPRKLNDAKDIIDKLSEGNTVAVDLDHTPDKEKQRVMDMLAGYCYCTQSNIESINSNIYIISHTEIELDENTPSE